ncbi:IS1595 family transposase [Desulfovibrio sp. Fe33]|uniref:IS1595 family transposase n=1 Tax=Desulfovibrio sp. Fe33 TaxID=3020842 RepID=UPI00234DD826|nr:IS1595 family transposase [Desulfovibrio sp. Fe33]
MHEQHFLLSAKARSLSIPQVAEWDEETVFKAFRDMRWAKTGGEPCCPQCGSVAHYFSKRRRQWRCKDCGHTYSVTSGTWLHSTNLPLKTILFAITLLADGAKGISACQLMRYLGVQYKTAFTLYHKLRSALLATRHDQPAMKGEVQADGAYLNPYSRPANKAEDRPEKDIKSSMQKVCILVIRQIGEEGDGANRTLTYKIPTENAKDIRHHVEDNVQRGANVVTDEHPAYGNLAINFKHTRVNHKICYCGPNGENTNQAESFFARFRRMLKGQIHKVSPDYLNYYANEVAYREDTRRWDNGRIAFDMMRRMLTLDGESPFRGYWSRTNVSPAVATDDEPAGLAAAA